jgi:integrase/recombinase XerD
MVNVPAHQALLSGRMGRPFKPRLSRFITKAEREQAPFDAVGRVWRENRLAECTITQYRRWVRLFLCYCNTYGLDPRGHLTHAGVRRFAQQFGHARRMNQHFAITKAHTALGNWAGALQSLGEALPPWRSAEDRAVITRPTVLEEFAQYLNEHRGITSKTIGGYVDGCDLLLKRLQTRGRTLAQLKLTDIDALVVDRSRYWSLASVGNLCSGLRQFLRFLHSSGRLKEDLAGAVMRPFVRTGHRPPRALPWEDVQRILQAIDRSCAIGRRDYALLLLMTTYGCGAGEVIRLQLQDIDWEAGILHLMRPKTGVKIDLPLLPAVGRALVDYLRHGRPVHAPTRAVFVDMQSPHRALTSARAVSHALRKHAARAKVRASFLGSHTLRHSHACRQMELGVAPKVIGDVLGHRQPRSTAVYLRGAVARLRQLSLPVPT